MDHSELISELPSVEQLPVLKRLELARQRRGIQLAKATERDETEEILREKSCRLVFSPAITLLEAASRGDVNEVAMLLESGVEPDSRNEDGLTPLHQCCIDNCEEVLLLLLSYGANVNARDSELWTPLHAASCCGHIDICRHLVKHGADLLACNADGNMPYDICEDDFTLDYLESEMAVRGVTQEQIDQLRSAPEQQMLADLQQIYRDGGDLEERDAIGATPLHIAAANGYLAVVQFLLDCGVMVDPRDEDSWQPVHAAACWAQPLIIELLVGYGADINAKTDADETPFDLCEDLEVRELIAELGRREEERLHNFSRESYRMSKRKKPTSKFESPQYVTGNSSFEVANASRHAIRRQSLRDRSGGSLGSLEAKQEALLRSRSLEDASAVGKQDDMSNGVEDSPLVEKQDGLDFADLAMADSSGVVLRWKPAEKIPNGGDPDQPETPKPASISATEWLRRINEENVDGPKVPPATLPKSKPAGLNGSAQQSSVGNISIVRITSGHPTDATTIELDDAGNNPSQEVMIIANGAVQSGADRLKLDSSTTSSPSKSSPSRPANMTPLNLSSPLSNEFVSVTNPTRRHNQERPVDVDFNPLPESPGFARPETPRAVYKAPKGSIIGVDQRHDGLKIKTGKCCTLM